MAASKYPFYDVLAACERSNDRIIKKTNAVLTPKVNLMMKLLRLPGDTLFSPHSLEIAMQGDSSQQFLFSPAKTTQKGP